MVLDFRARTDDGRTAVLYVSPKGRVTLVDQLPGDPREGEIAVHELDESNISRRTMVGRSLAIALGVVSTGGLVAACGSNESAGATGQAGATKVGGLVYVGALEDVDDSISVAFHFNGTQAADKARAYLCDGKNTDQNGLAAWFLGTVGDGPAGLTAVDKSATITFTPELNGAVVTGEASLADGRKSRFVAARWENGSGIYDVTVGADGSYTGKSTAGDTMVGTIKGSDLSTVQATITMANGQTAKVHVPKLKNLPPSPADTYTALALRVDDLLMIHGRSGDIRKGAPGNNIIGGFGEF